MKHLFDSYNMRARLAPAFLVLMPLAFGMMTWVPNAKSIAEPLASVAVSAGMLFMLAAIVRDAGKKVEGQLIKEWGGFLPSVLMLRHEDTRIDDTTKTRYHAKLSSLLGIAMPTREEERDDPAKADERYLSCCKYLVSRTRDEKVFPLLKEENMNYGFRRNVLSLRPYGIGCSLIGVLSCTVKIYREYAESQSLSVWALLCLLACGVSLFIWCTLINRSFVLTGAEAYAYRLLETTEQL